MNDNRRWCAHASVGELERNNTPYAITNRVTEWQNNTREVIAKALLNLPRDFLMGLNRSKLAIIRDMSADKLPTNKTNSLTYLHVNYYSLPSSHSFVHLLLYSIDKIINLLYSLKNNRHQKRTYKFL